MLQPFLFPQYINQEIEAATIALNCLQGYWAEEIVLGDDDAPKIYAVYPYLFSSAFPSLAPSNIQSLALAGQFLARSIVIYDEIMDRRFTDRPATIDVLRAQALQFEAYHLLYQLFPPTAAFWQRLRGYMAEYAQACLQEQRFALGQRPWQEYTASLAFEIATAKSGIAKGAVAGLVELTGNDSLLAPLAESIQHFYIAHQMWDDLCDWKKDLQTGIPSLLLARVLPERPPQEKREAALNQLARELYYGGHAQYVLRLALESLDRADSLTTEMPDLLWRHVTAELRRQCEALLHDINRIVRGNMQRVCEQPKFTLSLPNAQSQWQQLAWDGLHFLVRQWQLGFGEARHIMNFSHKAGFQSADEYQCGDIFQRALIADTLSDADGLLCGRLKTVIDHEVEYLTNARLADGNGWSYFPHLLELPPDADDLAQTMQVLLRAGHRKAVADYCEGPLSVLLHHNVHPDGSFETWILPPEEERTEKQKRQAEFTQDRWGTGPDNDVIANLLYALHLYDPERFAETIERGVAYLEAHQQANGSWVSTWYHGPYYGTYVCLRLLTAVNPHSPAIQRAFDFLLSRQRSDGGWGIDDQSDPLSTALSLLGLAIGQRHGCDLPDPDRMAQALVYIQRSQEPDKTWPNCQFIRMEVGRAKGFVEYVLSYGSRTITTAFVTKAAIAWHSLTAQTALSELLQAGRVELKTAPVLAT